MKFIPAEVAKKFGRQLLTLQKNSPKVTFIAGVVGVVGTTILACRATIKLSDTVDEFHNDVEALKEVRDSTPEPDFEADTYRHDMAYVYTKGAYKITKLYIPSILLGSASIGLLTASHVTLNRRNSALSAAYAALSSSFDAYRERVRKEVGDEKELEIRHNIETKTRTVNGKEVEVKVAYPDGWSPYARFFDEGSANWQKNAELNQMFLLAQQEYANHLLKARGHVFLNEIYDRLDVERSQAGAVVGWVMDQGGDNYIDFGIYKATSERFMKGWEYNVLLDFNVDGVIYDKI